jgi:hypothetical protein
MDEGHVGLDKADLPEQAGQIEAEGVVDSTEPLVACEKGLEAHVTLGGRNRKQSTQVGIEADHEPARPRDRGHFVESIKRTNKMAEQKTAVDHVEMIARQSRVVCAGMDEVNIGVAIGSGKATRDGELVGTGIDRGDFALWTP